MSENHFDYNKWLTIFPLEPFKLKLKSLSNAEPQNARLKPFFSTTFFFQIIDITQMFRIIGYILRRLNEDFINLQPLTDFDGLTVKGSEELITDMSLTTLDFTSLIIFLNMLMEKAARLLHSSSTGDKPSNFSFNDWKEKISKDKIIVPATLGEIVSSTPWFDDLRELRVKYVIHHNFSICAISEKNEIRIRSSLKDYKEEKLSIEDMQKISNEVYDFFVTLSGYLCDNVNTLPIRINTKIN